LPAFEESLMKIEDARTAEINKLWDRERMWLDHYFALFLS
jgi:hypothetical protein